VSKNTGIRWGAEMGRIGGQQQSSGGGKTEIQQQIEKDDFRLAGKQTCMGEGASRLNVFVKLHRKPIENN
jgi:hypothetical protein